MSVFSFIFILEPNANFFKNKKPCQNLKKIKPVYESRNKKTEMSPV